MRITLRQLSVFRAVFETGQLSRAAHRLSMSVSAVSQSLRELEAALGTTLFERNAAGAKPSESAQTLYPRAVLLVKRAEEIESIFLDRSRGLAGKLVIGSNRNYGIYVLSRRLPVFKSACPAIDTVLRIEDDEKILEAVRNNEVDVGFVSRVPTDSDLTSFVCYLERMCIVAGASSNIPHLDLKLEDLSAVTWVLPEEKGLREMTLRWLREQGAYVTQSILMNQFGAVKRAVATGLGVTYLSYLSVCEELKRGEMIELFEEETKRLAAPLPILAVYKEERLPELRQTFFEHCGIRPIESTEPVSRQTPPAVR